VDKIKTEKAVKWLVAVAALALVCVNVARILLIPATKDEVIMYPYIHQPYGALLRMEVVATANFHLLNLIITKFCITHFADNLFFLRLGSLMGLVLYLIYSWRISKDNFKNPWLVACTFLLLNANPFMLEFWTLSRGYGLSFALMLASIYHAQRYVRGEDTLQVVLTFAFALPAVYANLSLLYFYVGLLGALATGLLLYTERRHLAKRAGTTLLIAVITSSLLYLLISGPIQKLVDGKELYHGGNTGLFADTLKTVVKESLFIGDVNSGATEAVSWLIVTITWMAGVCVALVMLLPVKSPATQTLVFCFLLLVLPLVANSVQHHRDGTLYLIDRAALFLYIPFVLLLMATIQMSGKDTFAAAVAAFAFAGLATTNFAVNFSLHTTWQRAFDSANTRILDRMSRLGPQDRHVRFRSFWLFGESMEYHVATTHRNRFDISRSDMQLNGPVDTTQDYYYVPVEFKPRFDPWFLTDTFVIVGNPDAYNGQYVLLKRKQ